MQYEQLAGVQYEQFSAVQYEQLSTVQNEQLSTDAAWLAAETERSLSGGKNNEL